MRGNMVRVCGVKGHNKQTCPVTKKQRQEELLAQQKQRASAECGLSNTANDTVADQTPNPPANDTVADQNTIQGEIELTHSQPPPITTSPTRMVQRPKLTIRTKPTPITSPTAGTSSQTSPPASAPNLDRVTQKKAMHFMPTPGLKKNAP
ncbi:hypothetical protein SESBI_14111 [Sesbania bispinosa]|nr:hypothetical protein SESBI_14111 [Sesbania bispinosa]